MRAATIVDGNLELREHPDPEPGSGEVLVRVRAAGLAVTTEGFREVALRLAALRLPSVLVQEGGYPSEDLGRNLVAFLDGFEPPPGAK